MSVIGIGLGVPFGSITGIGISNAEPDLRYFTSETGVQWRRGIRDHMIILDYSVDGTWGTEGVNWINKTFTYLPSSPYYGT